jgi:hypothetical protein
MAGRSRRWFWHEADCLRVSRTIYVAVRVSGEIVVSVIGPQTAGGEGSAKGKAFTKGKVSTKRPNEAMADRKPMTCEASTGKMRAARHATTESHRVGGHVCRAEY